MAEKRKFTTARPSEAVEIDGAGWFVLGADAGAAVRYRDALQNAAVYQDGRLAGIRDQNEAEPALVAACLYKAGPDGTLVLLADGRPDPRHQASLTFVKGLPPQVMSELFDAVKALTPNLMGQPTAAGVRRQLAVLGELLPALEAREAAAADPKAPPPAPPTSS